MVLREARDQARRAAAGAKEALKCDDSRDTHPNENKNDKTPNPEVV
jgi:hypothetical protein